MTRCYGCCRCVGQKYNKKRNTLFYAATETGHSVLTVTAQLRTDVASYSPARENMYQRIFLVISLVFFILFLDRDSKWKFEVKVGSDTYRYNKVQQKKTNQTKTRTLMDVPMHARHTHSSDRTVSCHLIFPELMAAPGEFWGAKGGGTPRCLFCVSFSIWRVHCERSPVSRLTEVDNDNARWMSITSHLSKQQEGRLWHGRLSVWREHLKMFGRHRATRWTVFPVY